MTPAQLRVYADAFVENVKLERKREERRIYNLAALIRVMVWAKHPPRFENVFPEEPEEHKPMTDEQMFDQVKALNALFGGKEE